MLSVERFEVVSYCVDPACACSHRNGIVEQEISGESPESVRLAAEMFRRNGRYDHTELVAFSPDGRRVVMERSK